MLAAGLRGVYSVKDMKGKDITRVMVVVVMVVSVVALLKDMKGWIKRTARYNNLLDRERKSVLWWWWWWWPPS